MATFSDNTNQERHLQGHLGIEQHGYRDGQLRRSRDRGCSRNGEHHCGIRWKNFARCGDHGERGVARVDRSDACQSRCCRGPHAAVQSNRNYSDNSTNDITSSVTWSSDTTTVATINTAKVWRRTLIAGTAKITATSGDHLGHHDADCEAATLESIAVTPLNPSVGSARRSSSRRRELTLIRRTKDLTTMVTWSSGTTTVATDQQHGSEQRYWRLR